MRVEHDHDPFARTINRAETTILARQLVVSSLLRTWNKSHPGKLLGLLDLTSRDRQNRVNAFIETPLDLFDRLA